jgi:TP53 regulating kinase-like protein
MSTITPKPPRYHNSTWELISQGAEARVWLVPNYMSVQKGDGDGSLTTTSAICKERFAKSYRHPVLNDTLTRARTKAEVRSLIRCRRGGVSVPVVLGIDIPHKQPCNDGDNDTSNNDGANQKSIGANTSACIFMEKVGGCTVRSFLTIGKKEQDEDSNCEEPATKKVKVDDNTAKAKNKRNATRLDDYAKRLAHATGIAIAKMHNVNIIHGDLTTSNILLRNPVPPVSAGESSDKEQSSNCNSSDDWKPDIVIIDFGLSSTSVNSSAKRKSASASCHEERAVDLYVLERAFITTHVGGEELVEEILRGYKSSCKTSDSVFQRLSTVRMRGRKRECFG